LRLWSLAVAILRGSGPQPLAAGLASGNGRIEAVEIDVATKTPGRIKEILVNEGDFVTAGQVRHEAEAQLQGAIIGVAGRRSSSMSTRRG
jgi:HlyD family secretion protein